MKIKSIVAAAAAAWILSACSASGPATTAGGADEFVPDQATLDYYGKLPNLYKTRYFILGVPEGWSLVSFKNQPLDAHVSVRKNDHSSTVTIRVKKAKGADVNASCDMALTAYEANGLSLKSSGVSFGTCIIEGSYNDKPEVLWLRNYADDGSAYSITFTGAQESANEVLQYLAGNEKMMGLLVRPL